MNQQLKQNSAKLTVVVMAKAAVPGRVKTRLTRGADALSPDQAAEIHDAMFSVVLQRLSTVFHTQYGPSASLCLAMDDPGAAPSASELCDMIIPQGEGDLGERLDRVWQHCIEQTGQEAVVFFGVDSPDVPTETLRSIGPALDEADVAVGPVSDGGYWTLAAGRYLPGLLVGIDWGTPTVYDQTCAAAQRLGTPVHRLASWHDVDEPGDLLELRRRLKSIDDPALRQFDERLNQLLRNPEP